MSYEAIYTTCSYCGRCGVDEYDNFANSLMRKLNLGDEE